MGFARGGRGRVWSAAGIGCTSCAVLLLLAVGCSGARSEQRRIEGDTYLKLDRVDEALEAYELALTADPENARAHLGMARVSLAQGDAAKALEEARRAYELDRSIEEAYQVEAGVLLDRQETDAAFEVVTKLEAVNPVTGGVLRAAALRRLNRSGEALTVLTQLRDTNPKSLEVGIALANALLQAGQLPEAEAEATRVIAEIDAEAVAPRMLLIEAYDRQGRTDEIVGQFEELVAARPDDSTLRLGLARALLLAGRADEAEVIAKELLEADSENPWANYVMGACQLAAGRRPEAVPYLQTAASLLPEQPIVQQALDAARSATAGTLGTTLTPATPDQGVAPVAPAASPKADWQTLWKQASLVELLDRRDEFLGKGDPFVLETVIASAVLTQNADLARQLAAQLPEDSRLRVYIAALDQKDFQKVMAAFEGWEPPEPEMQIIRQNAVGFALSLAGARDQALRVLSDVRTQWPENAVALMTISQLFRSASMPQFAAASLRIVTNQYPNNIEAQRVLFQLLRESGNAEEARMAAETAYTLFPSEPATVLNLSQAYLDANELDQAREVLDLALKARPAEAALRLAVARVALESGDVAAAEAALGQQPPSADQETQWLLHKALGSALSNDWEIVASLCARLPERNRPAVGRLLLAGALVRKQDMEGASAQLVDPETGSPALGPPSALAARAMGREVPNLSPDQVALAEQLGSSPDLLSGFLRCAALQVALLHDQAYPALDELASALGNPVALLPYQFTSLAKAHSVTDRAAEARRLIEPHAGVAAASMALASLLEANGYEPDARDAMRRATELDANNAVAWFRLGQLEERSGSVEAAITAYRRAAELDPESAAVNNNLAYCLLTSGGDVAEALTRAKSANEKLQGNPQVLHTLGLAQMRSGDQGAARESLSLALQIRPGDPTLMLDYGLLLLELGQAADGRAQLETAVRYADQFGLPFPRRAEAEQALAE